MAAPTTPNLSSHDRVRLQMVAKLTDGYNGWITAGADVDSAMRLTLDSTTAGPRVIAEFKAAVA